MRLHFASAGRSGGVDRSRRTGGGIIVDKSLAGRVARLDAPDAAIAQRLDDRLVVMRAGAPRDIALRRQQEWLPANSQHHRRAGTRHSAKPGMKFAPAPVVA